MDFNIVQALKEQLDEQTLGYIDSLISVDIAHTTSAIRTGIPALLESLQKVANDKERAPLLADAIISENESVLDGFGEKLMGDEQRALVNSGINHLSSILGDADFAALSERISDFSDVRKTGVASMLGMFTPMVFSLIKKHLSKEEKTPSVESVAEFFKTQEVHIKHDMPKGFHEEEIMKQAEDEPQAVLKNAREEEGVKERVRVEVSPQESERSRLLKVASIALLVLGGIWAYFNMHQKEPVMHENVALEQPVQETAPVQADMEKETKQANTVQAEPQTSTKATHNTLKEVKAMQKSVGDVMESLIRTFASVKDAQTANEALPNIKIMVDELSSYADDTAKFDAGERGLVSTVVADHMPKLQDTINTIGVIPGVGGVLRSVVVELLAVIARFK